MSVSGEHILPSCCGTMMITPPSGTFESNYSVLSKGSGVSVRYLLLASRALYNSFQKEIGFVYANM